jgi:hypothetical protein
MKLRSNPAGSEEYEVSVTCGFRPDHGRVFGFQRTTQPDCAKGGGLRRGYVGGYVRSGGSGLVREASRLRRCSRRDVQTNSRDFAAVLGGSPALSGGDLISTGASVAGGAVTVGSLGLSAVGSAAGAAGLLSSGAAGSTSAGTGSSSAMLASAGSAGGGGGTVSPPTTPPSPASSSPSQPTAPSAPSQPAAPMSDAARNLTGMHRRIASQVPPDSGPHATPPRLNIDHNE